MRGRKSANAVIPVAASSSIVLTGELIVTGEREYVTELP